MAKTHKHNADEALIVARINAIKNQLGSLMNIQKIEDHTFSIRPRRTRTAASARLTEFHAFQKLTPEIRVAVWQLAMPGPG